MKKSKKKNVVSINDYCVICWNPIIGYDVTVWNTADLYLRRNDCDKPLRNIVSHRKEQNKEYYLEVTGGCVYNKTNVSLHVKYVKDAALRVGILSHEYTHGVISSKLPNKRDYITVEEEEAVADIISYACILKSGIEDTAYAIEDTANHFFDSTRLTDKAISLAKEVATLMEVDIDIYDFIKECIGSVWRIGESLLESIESGELTDAYIIDIVEDAKEQDGIIWGI